jgi:hypothetical protein
MDFVSDKLADGRTFRVLTVVDQFTRECVWLEADRCMTGVKVATALSKAAAERDSLPASITCDNGSEFTPGALWKLGRWNAKYVLASLDPADRLKTASSKAFNGRLREECLNVSWFTSLTDAHRQLAAGRAHYNEQRPHSSLDDRAPAAFAKLHPPSGTRFALITMNKASAVSSQGFASPAKAALDSSRPLPEDTYYERAALERITKTRDSLLILWSAGQTQNTGLGRT